MLNLVANCQVLKLNLPISGFIEGYNIIPNRDNSDYDCRGESSPANKGRIFSHRFQEIRGCNYGAIKLSKFKVNISIKMKFSAIYREQY